MILFAMAAWETCARTRSHASGSEMLIGHRLGDEDWERLPGDSERRRVG